MDKTVSGNSMKINFGEELKTWLFTESEKRKITVSQLIRDCINTEKNKK